MSAPSDSPPETNPCQAARLKAEVAVSDAHAAVALYHAGKISMERLIEIGHECQEALFEKYLICGDPDSDDEPRGLMGVTTRRERGCEHRTRLEITDHDELPWHRFVCPDCGREWSEEP